MPASHAHTAVWHPCCAQLATCHALMLSLQYAATLKIFWRMSSAGAGVQNVALYTELGEQGLTVDIGNDSVLEVEKIVKELGG